MTYEEECVALVAKLSPAEHEVLLLTCKGFTAKEIARMQDRSWRTIEVHMSNIRRKFGMSHMAEIAVTAVKGGLL